MSWDRIKASWKRIKDETVFWRERLRGDDRNRIDLLGSNLSSEGRNSDTETTSFRPDDSVRRSEFSLHIGC